jgi:hypothetical protein
MEDALRRFHTFKNVFLLGRSSKKAKLKPNALRTELVKIRKVDKETNADTWTPSNMQCEMNAWWDYICHKIYVSKELDADFNFPKIHLMSHWVKHICRYGALQQYSAKRHTLAHETNLKDCLNASNHDLNYLPQVITFHHRILGFEVRELNLQALAQRRQESAAALKGLPSGDDQVLSLSPQ